MFSRKLSQPSTGEQQWTAKVVFDLIAHSSNNNMHRLHGAAVLPITVQQPQPHGYQDGDQDIPTGRGNRLFN